MSYKEIVPFLLSVLYGRFSLVFSFVHYGRKKTTMSGAFNHLYIVSLF